MPNWKKALVVGSFAAGALLMFKGYKGAAALAAGTGAAILASEYPEQVRDLWEKAPQYAERGAVIMAAISKLRERLEQEGSRAISGSWREAAS